MLEQTSFASSPHRFCSLMRPTRWFTNIKRNSAKRPRFLRGTAQSVVWASESGSTKQLSPASITCSWLPLAKNLPSTCMSLRTCIMECIVFYAFLLHPHYDFAFGASLGQVLKGLLCLIERKHFVYNRMDMTGVKKRANCVQLLAVRSHE